MISFKAITKQRDNYFNEYYELEYIIDDNSIANKKEYCVATLDRLGNIGTIADLRKTCSCPYVNILQATKLSNAILGSELVDYINRKDIQQKLTVGKRFKFN